MGKVSKYLLAFLLALAGVEAAIAATTKFTDLQCRNMTITGTLTSGGCTCTNISTSTVNAASLNATYGVTGATVTATGAGTFGSVVTSTITLSGAQALRLPDNYITPSESPAAAHILAIDSDSNLYISTGTGAGAWVKVGGQ